MSVETDLEIATSDGGRRAFLGSCCSHSHRHRQLDECDSDLRVISADAVHSVRLERPHETNTLSRKFCEEVA
jgi:hypothetical protein